MALEVTVATKTMKRRSPKRGRTVRFIGKMFLVAMGDAKCGKESKILGFEVSDSDPSSSSENLGIGEEEKGVRF